MQQLFRLRFLEADTQWLTVAKSPGSLSLLRPRSPHASHGRLPVSARKVPSALGALEPRTFCDLSKAMRAASEAMHDATAAGKELRLAALQQRGPLTNRPLENYYSWRLNMRAMPPFLPKVMMR